MDWGDAATWVGCGAAIVAAIYSAKSARTAAESLRMQREEAAPAVEWRLERDSPSERWGVFFLRNTGTLDAARVTITYPPTLAPLLVNTDIAAQAAHPIVIVCGVGEPPATHLKLTWQGQDEPVTVAIPTMA